MTEQEVLTMSREKVYNFSAGPSMMPESVLNKAGSEISDYMGSGMSVMEMSHRSSLFGEIFAETKRKLKEALNVPDSHEILFLQGGATLQFAAIPLNLMGSGKSADYAVTGNFSGLAAKEAEKYGRVHIACDSSTADTAISRQSFRSARIRAIFTTARTTPYTEPSGRPCPIQMAKR